MKCQKCGAELDSKVLFCRECGSKIEKKIAFCRECGEKIDEGIKFCSNCGANINLITDSFVESGLSDSKLKPTIKSEPISNPKSMDEPKSKPTLVSESVAATYSNTTEIKAVHQSVENNQRFINGFVNSIKNKLFTVASRIISKALKFWNSMDTFGKAVTTSTVMVAILLIASILANKNTATMFSLLQIFGIAISTLIHKEVIKSSDKRLKYIILFFAILFTALTVFSFSCATRSSVVQSSSNNKNTEETAEPIDWENITLYGVLPKPQSNMMNILHNGDDWLNVTIQNISENDYLEYVRWCKDDYGFTVDSETFGDYFYAYNQNGYYITLLYDKTSKSLNIDLDVPSEDISETPDDAGEQPSVLAEEQPPFSDQTEEPQTTQQNKTEVAVPASAHEFKFDNYKDVQQSLETAGFANITTAILYDIVWGWTLEGEVESVSINGSTDYKKGESFNIDAPIVITYHMKKEDDPKNANTTTITTTTTTTTTNSKTTQTEATNSSPVFYSTNTRETVNNGNSGIYSYISEFASYDVYWIIDFDAGYVYYFTEGNGESTCDRLKIDSGDLNTAVKITYHYYGDTWSYRLHFKYVNHSEHLVMVDHNGFECDYYTTNLSDALALRDTKTIKDY